jgi:hypothetical protein
MSAYIHFYPGDFVMAEVITRGFITHIFSSPAKYTAWIHDQRPTPQMVPRTQAHGRPFSAVDHRGEIILDPEEIQAEQARQAEFIAGIDLPAQPQSRAARQQQLINELFEKEF